MLWIMNWFFIMFEGWGGDFDVYVIIFCLLMMFMICYDFLKEGMMRSWGDILGVWYFVVFIICWRIIGVFMVVNMIMNNLNMKKFIYVWVFWGVRFGVLICYLFVLWIDGLFDGMIGLYFLGIFFIIFFYSLLCFRNVL